MVNYIVNHVEATLYEIEPLIAYPSDYNVTTKVAEQEKIENARPAIKNSIDIYKYDFIFVGFPIWWYVAPTIINTFLESYNLTGKTIIPFATSGGSGMGKTNEKLMPSCPGATLLEGKVLASNIKIAELNAWVENLKL